MNRFNLELAIIQALGNFSWRDAVDLSCTIYARHNKSISDIRIGWVAHTLTKRGMIRANTEGNAWRLNRD